MKPTTHLALIFTASLLIALSAAASDRQNETAREQPSTGACAVGDHPSAQQPNGAPPSSGQSDAVADISSPLSPLWAGLVLGVGLGGLIFFGRKPGIQTR